MAAGESPPESGTKSSEDDNEWSDFTYESTKISDGLPFGGQEKTKSLPSRDSGIFTHVSDTTRVCFPHEVSNSWDAFAENQNAEADKTDRKITLLGEYSYSHCRQSSKFLFPHPHWKGSSTECSLLSSLNVATPHKAKENDTVISNVNRQQSIFNFHRLSERNIELWRSSKTSSGSWDTTDLETSNSASHMRQQTDSSKVVPSCSNIDQAELSEIMDELDVWSDSESGETTDDIFMLFGRRLNERPTSFDECQAAAGLRHLSHEELVDLRDEMSAYVKEYSDVLVDELMVKDEQIREKEMKNLFISSLLTLQSKLREVQSNQGRKKNGPSANIYLTTVIPYEEQVGGPKTADLEKIIEIMDAMAEDSATVPNLLTGYILKVLCP